MRRKALAKQVTGGRVFGYDNVDVTEIDAAGRPPQLYVARRVNEAEASVVSRTARTATASSGSRRR